MPGLSDLLEVAIDGPPADLSEAWRDGLGRALEAIFAERARRDDLLAELRESLGDLVVLRATPDAPLRAAGFDPMNLTGLADGHVLHERYLALTVGETRITVLNHPTLTTVIGAHPLFAGLDRAEVLVQTSLITAIEDEAPPALPTLGIRIEGSCDGLRTGPGMIELVPGTSTMTGR